MTTDRDPSEQRAIFFDAVLGQRLPDELWAHIWQPLDKQTDWVHSPEEAEQAALRNGRHDVYLGLALLDHPGASDERVKIATASGLLGLPMDLDVKDDAHKEKALPDTKELALAFLDSVPLPPTIVVDSGHGLQAWWLFQTPWVFDDDTPDRLQAMRLGYGWQAQIRSLAAEHGWKLDNVGDLARILRVPGTLNAKNRQKVKPVRLLRYSPAHRYTPADFEPYIAKTYTPPNDSGSFDYTRRFRRDNPCPICKGYQELPPGIGERCWGFLSKDGTAAFCTRGEYAGRIKPISTSIGEEVWVHQLNGKPCLCGKTHAKPNSNGTTDESPNPFRLLDDVEVEQLAPARWLIEGYLLEDTVGTVYGQSGVWKTFLVVDMAMCLTVGMDWMGGKVSKAGAVVFISGEGARNIGKRVHAWRVKHDYYDRVPIYVLNTMVNFLDPQQVEFLIVTIREKLGDGRSPVLIVVDTLALAMAGGDENKQQDASKLLAAANLIRTTFGSTVLFIHHTGYELSRMRGSSVFHNNGDITIRVASDLPPAQLAAGAPMTVSCEKMRDEPKFKPFVVTTELITWVDDGGEVFSSLVAVPYVGPAVVKKKRLTDLSDSAVTARAALKCLLEKRAKDDTDGIINAVWKEATKDDMAPSTFNLSLKKLLANGWVKMLDNGKYDLSVPEGGVEPGDDDDLLAL